MKMNTKPERKQRPLRLSALVVKERRDDHGKAVNSWLNTIRECVRKRNGE